MTPNRGIFCNTPWYELHIYWDGSLGICCQEDRKLYQDSKNYNIANMSIKEWFNSEPARRFRSSMLGDQRVPECRRCYEEEDAQGHSRRLKSNAKSVIFTRQAFVPSIKQSPGYQQFHRSGQQQGSTDTLPIDLHIDLGNHCNLACKMCYPRASSTIASQMVKWGDSKSRQYLGTDWTRDQRVWDDFLSQLIDIPNLKNIHFMGGETLLSRRLEQLVDWFIAHERFEVCFSFVTNGTIYPHDLMTKMSRFDRLGIEVSVETMTPHNHYTRQGTDHQLLLKNLDLFQRLTNDSCITVALRPAPNLLTVGNYHTLLDFALQNDLIVKSNLCRDPEYLRIELLPDDVKHLYLARIDGWASTVAWPDHDRSDYNASDPSNTIKVVQEELDMIRSLLSRPCPDNSHDSLERLVRHLERWDRVYGLDARVLYPELLHTLDSHNYHV